MFAAGADFQADAMSRRYVVNDPHEAQQLALFITKFPDEHPAHGSVVLRRVIQLYKRAK